MRPIVIAVEGATDKEFIQDYLKFLNTDLTQIEIIEVGGITGEEEKLVNKDETFRIKFNKNSDEGGINVIIFDADKDVESRKIQIFKGIQHHNLICEDVFLLPNNKDRGALEDLLEKAILDKHRGIFACWDSYTECLTSKNYPTPDNKAKIYTYRFMICNSDKEREVVKSKKVDFCNAQCWNHNSEAIEPLKLFLTNILERTKIGITNIE